MSQVSEKLLASIAETIPTALRTYSEATHGGVVFDVDAAAKLELTPDKPNTARSTTQVKHLGEVAGTLYIIVFDSKDGTGDENTYTLNDSMLGGFYPLESKLVPRSKVGVHSEAHLSLASFFPNGDEDPIMFANHLDLVSFKQGRMSRLAVLGHDLYDYTQATFGNTKLEPTTTLTTGYDNGTGERFGDPHAVFNQEVFVQVAGFLAIANDVAAQHLPALQRLGATQPELAF